MLFKIWIQWMKAFKVILSKWMLLCVCTCVCACVCVCVSVCVCMCGFNFLDGIADQREASLERHGRCYYMMIKQLVFLQMVGVAKVDLVCYIWKGLLVNQFRHIDVKNRAILLICIPFYVKMLVFLMSLWFNMRIYNGGIIYLLYNLLRRF